MPKMSHYDFIHTGETPLLESPSCTSGPKAERDIHCTFMPCLDRNWTGVGGQIYVAFYTVLYVLVLINTLGTLVIVRKEDGGGEYFVVLFWGEDAVCQQTSLVCSIRKYC